MESPEAKSKKVATLSKILGIWQDSGYQFIGDPLKWATGLFSKINKNYLSGPREIRAEGAKFLKFQVVMP